MKQSGHRCSEGGLVTAGSMVNSGAPHGSVRAQRVLSPSVAGRQLHLVTEGDKQLLASLRPVKA